MNDPNKEPIHVEFDARLRASFDPNLLAVYSDWLQERGDPRGSLIRVQLDARRSNGPVARYDFELDEYGEDSLVLREPEEIVSATLLNSNWHRWFGPIQPRSVRFTWSGGFVREAEVRAAPQSWPSCRPLLCLQSLRFVRALRVSQRNFSGSLEGLDSAACLEELSWRVDRSDAISPLRGVQLPRLTKLKMELAVALSADDILGLVAMLVI